MAVGALFLSYINCNLCAIVEVKHKERVFAEYLKVTGKADGGGRLAVDGLSAAGESREEARDQRTGTRAPEPQRTANEDREVSR